MEIDKPIRCAVIGQNPMRFPWGFDEEDESCGKMKMELAQHHDLLRLMPIGYTPHEEQVTKWAPYLRERYFDMLTACTYLSAVCEAGAPGAQLQAYKKIIDLADVVLCVYDTDIPATSSAEDRALAYAEGQHKSLVLLHPTELTTKQISAAHDAR